MSRKKLAIVSSHPIQYNAPMFALLAQSLKVEPKVFYTWSQSRENLFDKDFGRQISWDIPLLEGYAYEFVENVSSNAGTGSFWGIDCPELISSIKAWKPDALLVYGWNYKAHLSVMRHFKGKIPVYFRGDSTLIDEMPGWRTMLRRTFLRWVYSHCDGAFHVGQNNKEYFLKHGLSEKELFFAPHAIDNQRFGDPDGLHAAKAQGYRASLGICDEDLVLLFVGKFEPKKNPLLLLKAFGSIARPNVHLVFVGNGVLEDDLRREAANLAKVHFMPFQNQSLMPAVYRIGDALVLPSQGPGETWGLVINEAMACSRAVVASNKCGAAVDLIAEGENGFIFQSGNLDELTVKLGLLLADTELIGQMGQKSLERIQSWSFQAIVNSIENHC